MSRIPFEMDQEDVDRDYDALFGDAPRPEPAPDPQAEPVFYRADGTSGNGRICELCGFMWVEHIAPGCRCPMYAKQPDPHAEAMAAGLGAVDRALLAPGGKFDRLAALVQRNDELEEQVDELADALENCRVFFATWWSAGRMRAWDVEVEGVVARVTEALRKAGRL